MPVAPSFDDLLAQFAAEATAQFAPRVLRLGDGDMTTALQHGAAAMADVVLRFAVQAFRDTFIDGAKGDALSALVDDHLNIQKQQASFAQATVQLTRTSGGAAGTLPAGFTVGSAFDASGNTVLFTLDSSATFTLGSNGPISVPVTAQIAGIAGNVAAGAISRVVDAPFDRTVVVTNLAVAAGGNEEESDPELRVRARNFWQTLRRGTLGALEFGALSVPSVRIARATEDPLTGLVTLVVSDSTGHSTVQMIADVSSVIEAWRAAGAVVNILGGVPLVVDVIGRLIAKIGVDTSVLGVVSQDAVIGRMNKLAQGEILYLDSIKAAALGVDPDSLEALVLTTPTTDIAPAANQVIRPGTVTIT